MSDTPRLQPLFPAEPVELTLSELRAAAVDAFPGSWAREDVWRGFERLVVAIGDAGLGALIYVDGSFVTDKRDPGDIDVLLHVDTPHERLTGEQEAFLIELEAALTTWKRRERCDIQLVLHSPGEDARAAVEGVLNNFVVNVYGPPKRAVLIRLEAATDAG